MEGNNRTGNDQVKTSLKEKALRFILTTASSLLGALTITAVARSIKAQSIDPLMGLAASFEMFFFTILFFPLAFVVLFILFWFWGPGENKPSIKPWMEGALLGAVAGVWMMKFLDKAFQLYYVELIPFAAFILGWAFIRPSAPWLNIRWIVAGTGCGLVLSYLSVILWRHFDNTLTSYFWFNPRETFLVLGGVLVMAIAGNFLGYRKARAAD